MNDVPRITKSGNRMITLYMPIRWIKILDKLVKDGVYHSRAEAIRAGIKEMINLDLKKP